jgi:hypothetical protein
MLGFDDTAQGIIDQRLIAALPSQGSEVFHDGGVEHDIDA